ncbi:MAG: hypothetical protein K8R92_11195 [Planctomycetes bacterium]|nr:hypothetical protein [Planctomycetota bacterium]
MVLCSTLHAQGVVEPPLPWKVKLVSGASVKGSISKWDFEGIEGTFGRAAWKDFRPDDANRLCRKLMDWRQGGSYLGLARMLFALEGGDKLAESALRDAIKRDRALADDAEALRLEVAQNRRKAVEDRRIAKEKDFQDKTVGAGAPAAGDAATHAKPWSVATDAERAEALAEMKADAERWLKQVNLRYSMVEGDFWVLYADLPLGETRELARRMDAMYQTVAEMFGLPAGLNIFHGKAVVIVSATDGHYRAIEKAAFDMEPPPGAIGLCHMVGPKVVVSAYRSEDANRFMSTLVHEASHGFMHRYGSPMRLPAWADEGYAEYVAAESFPQSTTKGDRTPQGLEWIRAGNNDVQSILRLNYEDGSWPGANAIGYAIGYMTVDFLIHTDGRKFGAWVKDVKAGIPWEEAMQKRFGWNAQQLAQAVKQRYMARD